MSHHIHITGISPRCGTTLLAELMFACFDIDVACVHESSVFNRPDQEFDVYCSKDPNDLSSVRLALLLDPTLWVICLIRDPRDAIVSKHAANPGKYCTNLSVWKRGLRSYRRLQKHPRFFEVKYEDL
ncbi:MAG: sulfotransferase, partial [Proteobacteria bacterium]|nr:sulfotransferase [Pseudomonadota bacterium]